MPNELDPIENNWYHHIDKGVDFFVVAVDEDEGLIEVQNFEGDLEEIDFEEWEEMDLEPCEAPEDYAGPIDVLDQDDLGYTP